MTFEPVVSEIFPVKAGAITDDIMPKKLNTPKVVPIPIFGAFSPSQEIIIGSTANFPKNPYIIKAINNNVALLTCTVNKSMANATSEEDNPIAAPWKPRSVLKKLGNQVTII